MFRTQGNAKGEFPDELVTHVPVINSNHKKKTTDISKLQWALTRLRMFTIGSSKAYSRLWNCWIPCVFPGSTGLI